MALMEEVIARSQYGMLLELIRFTDKQEALRPFTLAGGSRLESYRSSTHQLTEPRFRERDSPEPCCIFIRAGCVLSQWDVELGEGASPACGGRVMTSSIFSTLAILALFFQLVSLSAEWCTKKTCFIFMSLLYLFLSYSPQCHPNLSHCEARSFSPLKIFSS